MCVDSGGYITASINRSPLYPLLIQGFSFFDSSLQLLILLQLLLGWVAVHVFLNALQRIFKLDLLLSIIVLIFIALPYYFIFLSVPLFVGNVIMTEAICYPLFLLAIAAICHAVQQQQLRFYIYFIILTMLLILTRRQFIFLYPFFGIVWLSLFLQQSQVKFSKALLLGMFIISIIATNILEKTYQYIQHDKFTTIPFTGRQLLVLPMFVAKAGDANLFADNSVQQRVFSDIYAEMTHRRITFADQSLPLLNLYNVFEKHYNTVSHRIIPPAVHKAFGVGFDEYKLDACTVQIALTLIKHNFKDYLKLYAKNIEVNLGQKSFVLFLLLVFAVTFINYIKSRSLILLILLFALILQFGNYMLIALVEPILWRYTIYTNQVLFVLMALCMVRRSRIE